MTIQKTAAALLSSLGILAVILDGKTALLGASAGLELCVRTVIPALFPLLFLCKVLTDALWGQSIPALRPLMHLLGIPQGSEAILIAGFLGGYPAGARAVGDAYREGRLSKQTAGHLLRFCNNAGPAFLFGMTASRFPGLAVVWKLWLVQILSALLTGLLHKAPAGVPVRFPPKRESISTALQSAVKTTALICGWVILFRLLLAFPEVWLGWKLRPELQTVISGLLELSIGCCLLEQIPDMAARFVICSLFLSFGGLCVTMQTLSVLEGLSAWDYLLGKLTQTAVCLCLALPVYHEKWGIVLLLWVGVSACSFLLKKRGSIPAAQRV